MKKNRLYMNPAVSAIFLILFEAYLVFFGPAVCRLAALKLDAVALPEDVIPVLATKAKISDVNWLHVRAEKVVFCDRGTDYVRDYVKGHNTPETLEYISICSFDALSDMRVYDYDWIRDEELKRKIREDGFDKYVLIVYMKPDHG